MARVHGAEMKRRSSHELSGLAILFDRSSNERRFRRFRAQRPKRNTDFVC